MVGSALVRRLAAENVELLTATRSEADLRDQDSMTILHIFIYPRYTS